MKITDIEILGKIKTKKFNEIIFSCLKSNSEKALNILFLGVTHGEEPQGYFLINKFIEEIKEKNLKFKNNLYFIPCINPDGKAINQRGNSNNVDLNRNFATKNYEVTTFDDGTTSGKFAKSEMETQFLSYVIENYNLDIILSFHAPFAIVNYDGPAKEIAEEISKITGYPIQVDIGYPTPGSFGTFCGVEKNIPTITLEVDEKLTDDELWLQNEPVFKYLANFI